VILFGVYFLRVNWGEGNINLSFLGPWSEYRFLHLLCFRWAWRRAVRISWEREQGNEGTWGRSVITWHNQEDEWPLGIRRRPVKIKSWWRYLLLAVRSTWWTWLPEAGSELDGYWWVQICYFSIGFRLLVSPNVTSQLPSLLVSPDVTSQLTSGYWWVQIYYFSFDFRLLVSPDMLLLIWLQVTGESTYITSHLTSAMDLDIENRHWNKAGKVNILLVFIGKSKRYICPCA